LDLWSTASLAAITGHPIDPLATHTKVSALPAVAPRCKHRVVITGIQGGGGRCGGRCGCGGSRWRGQIRYTTTSPQCAYKPSIVTRAEVARIDVAAAINPSSTMKERLTVQSAGLQVSALHCWAPLVV